MLSSVILNFGKPVESFAADFAAGALTNGQVQAFAESHQKMLQMLEAIRLNTQQTNPYQGDGNVRKLREAVTHLTADSSLQTRLETYLDLGRAELVLGNEEQAIAALTQAYQWMRSNPSLDAAKAVRDKVLLALGVAHMRLAETENCCAQDSPGSCILPLANGGLHAEKRGAEGAIRYLRELFNPADTRSQVQMETRWLLNIAHMALGQYPDAVPAAYRIPEQTFKSRVPFPRFENISASLGLNTFSLAGGVVCDDFDNDGYFDLLVTTWDASGQIRFFRNNGDGTFSDKTETSGLVGILGGLNLVQADYNNDGFVDVLVLRGAWLYENGRHPNSLLHNNGNGTFTDVTFAVGLGDVHYPTQTASWADYDLDGDLDLYIGNESFSTLIAPSQLFRNNGDGTFTDVADSAGVRNDRFAKAVIWGDYDSDRYPDIYISNLSEPNRLYHNNGNGTFSDVAVTLGVDQPVESFPAWFFDVNNDGALDLFVSAYSAQIGNLVTHYLGKFVLTRHMPKLYLNHGDGRFEDAGKRYGLDHPSLPMGSNFGDLDGDGFIDFYLGTGDPDFKNLMPNLMYLNQNGERFVDVTMAGGFGHLQKGHGVAFADLDGDGDEDVFEEMGGAFLGDKFADALYENPGFGNRWIAIQPVGTTSNRSAIGTRIRVVAVEKEKPRSIYKWVNSGGSFGASPLRQFIGLGKAEEIQRIEIFWPRTARTQTLINVPLDSVICVTEGNPDYQLLPVRSFKLGKRNS